MPRLTKNIYRHELACKCGCGFQSMDWETIEIIQACCDHFAETLGVDKVVLHIHSAARCFKHNRDVGSTDKSQHPLANAIDFHIEGVDPIDVFNYLCDDWHGRYGIGMYSNFTHFDTRKNMARW